MDEWNNKIGREIADDIRKKYGKNFNSFSQKEKDDIIAKKIISKMKSNEMITDTRQNSKNMKEILLKKNITKLKENFKI